MSSEKGWTGFVALLLVSVLVGEARLKAGFVLFVLRSVLDY